MKRIISQCLIIAVVFVFAGMTYAHNIQFEVDLENQDSTIENPWTFNDVNVAYAVFGCLSEGDIDYYKFEGTAEESIDDLMILFSSSMAFLPKVAVVGPGMTGGSIPEWVDIPAEGLGVMNYEYALDWLSEFPFGEAGGPTIVLLYDETRPFTLPETGTYWILVYHENKQPGYYCLCIGKDHSVVDKAENADQKSLEWIQSALALEPSSVSDWELLD